MCGVWHIRVYSLYRVCVSGPWSVVATVSSYNSHHHHTTPDLDRPASTLPLLQPVSHHHKNTSAALQLCACSLLSLPLSLT